MQKKFITAVVQWHTGEKKSKALICRVCHVWLQAILMWKQWPWSWDESQNKPAPAHHHSLLVLLLYVRARKCQIASFLKLLLKLFESAAAKKKKKGNVTASFSGEIVNVQLNEFSQTDHTCACQGYKYPGFWQHVNCARFCISRECNQTAHTPTWLFFFFLLIFMFVGFIRIVACSFKSFIFIVL